MALRSRPRICRSAFRQSIMKTRSEGEKPRADQRRPLAGARGFFYGKSQLPSGADRQTRVAVHPLPFREGPPFGVGPLGRARSGERGILAFSRHPTQSPRNASPSVRAGGRLSKCRSGKSSGDRGLPFRLSKLRGVGRRHSARSTRFLPESLRHRSPGQYHSR